MAFTKDPVLTKAVLYLQTQRKPSLSLQTHQTNKVLRSVWNNPTKSSQYSVLDTQSTVSRSTIFCHISSNQLLTVSRSADMNLGDACLFGLGHFGWALQVFFLTSLVMTGLTTTEPVSTFQSYTRCFYWVLLLGISAMLYWMTNLYASLTFSEIWRLWLFHASRPLVFVHYLKVCFDSYSIRGIARLQPACELLGVSCSLARLSAHGARGLSSTFSLRILHPERCGWGS